MVAHPTEMLDLAVAFADLRLYLAQRRFWCAVDDMVRKYRPDQPRAPKGTQEGGRWVTTSGTRPRIRTALAGVLIAQRVGLGDAGLVRHCIYEDMLGRQRTVEVNAAELCRPTYPARAL